MLAIPLGLYHTGSEYPGRSPILLVFVTPVLQWTHGYCPLGSYLIFDRYFPLINAFHVDLLSRRHQFSSIPAFAVSSRMVFPTCVIMVLPLFILLLIGSICGISCVEVLHNMRLGDGVLPHSLVGSPIMKQHKASLTFTNAFWYPPPGELLEDFS